MNGLELLSSITSININTLHMKLECDDRNISEFTIKELINVDMDDFKGLQLIDNVWTLVFKGPEKEFVDEPKCEEIKPKRKRRTKAEIEEDKAAETEALPQEYMNPPEPNQEEIDNVMDLFA